MPRKKKSDKLSDLERRFVAEYVAGMLTGTSVAQAYIRAGFTVTSVDSAWTMASRLLGKVGIQKAIADARALSVRNAGVTVDDIYKELRLIAFSDISDIVDFEAAGLGYIAPDKRRAVKTIRWKVNKDGSRTVSSIEMHSKMDGLAQFRESVGMKQPELTFDQLLFRLGPFGEQLRELLGPMLRGEEMPPQQQQTPALPAPPQDEAPASVPPEPDVETGTIPFPSKE